MCFAQLQEWLSWQQQLHPESIDLGLQRIRPVAERMGLVPRTRPVVVVAGTNGKGSVVAFLQSIYRAAGYRVGSYTSPHLLHYRERINLNGRHPDDASLCRAFAAVDAARGDTTLTFFEFGTLAALQLLGESELDLEVLEVGLGGRLDAVNIVDADCSVITSIELDHEAWLGDSRELIGAEKAAVMRPACPAIIGDPDPPASVRAFAAGVGAQARYQGHDFSHTLQDAGGWTWQGPCGRFEDLPAPGPGGTHQYANAATALAVVDAMCETLPVDCSAVRSGIAHASIPGRCSRVDASVETLLDVAHNPAGIAALSAYLRATAVPGRTRAVLGMMHDKHHEAGIRAIAAEIDEWYVCALADPRAADAGALADTVSSLDAGPVYWGMSVAAACRRCIDESCADDRLVVFGSFVTVAEALSGVAELGFDEAGAPSDG